jgi:hypothetical protein
MKTLQISSETNDCGRGKVLNGPACGVRVEGVSSTLSSTGVMLLELVNADSAWNVGKSIRH